MSKSESYKGIVIDIGGNTAPLNSALSEVNKTSNSLKGELKEVERFLKFDPTNTELVAQKQKLLAEQVENAKTKLNYLKQAQEQVEAAFKSGKMGEAEYRAFQRQVIAAEQALKSAENAQQEFEEECKKSGKAAKEAGEDSEKAGKKAKESGEDAKKGGSGWEKFGSFMSKAGEIIAGTVAAIGAGAVAAGAAVWDMATDAADAFDTIDEQSQVLGLSKTAYQEYSYVLAQNGMDMSNMTGVMKTLTAQMDAVTEGNKAAIANFEKLGISVYDSNGKLKSQEQMLAESITALQKMEDGTEKARLATELFGKQGQSLMPILNAEVGSVDEMRQKAHELGLVMDEEVVTAGANFNDSLDELKMSFSGLKNSLVSDLLPGFGQLTQGFTGLITGQEGAAEAIEAGAVSMIESFKQAVPQLITALKNVINSVIKIAPQILTALVEAFLKVLPELIDVAINILQSLLTAITNNIQKVVDVIMQIVTAIITFIIKNLPLFINAGIQIIIALINGIATALPQIIQAIVYMIPQLIQVITDNLPLIIQAGITLILSLVQGLIDAIPQLLEALPTIITALLDGILAEIPQLIDAGIQLLTALVAALPEIIQKIVEVLPKIIDSIITALLDNLPLIIQAGIDLLVALVKALPQIITTIVKAIPQIITSIIDALIGNIDKIIMAGVQLFVALIENLPKIIIEIVKAIPQIIDAIFDAFGSYAGKMAEIGLNLIKGIWQGISDAGAWLWDKISGFFGSITDKIKNFFGIASPSKWMRDVIGKNLVKGIGVGVEDEIPDLQETLDKNLSNVQAGIQATLNFDSSKISTPSTANAAKAPIFSINIDNFNNYDSSTDINTFTDMIMTQIEEKVRRRGAVFANG